MRRRHWIHASLLVLCFLPAGLSAQSIHGKLLDAESERPIAAATVTLLGLDGQAMRGVITDSSGAFVLQAPASGRYRLRAERIGYQAAVSAALDVFRGDTVAVELRLSTEAVLLAPLTVTVAPRPNLRNRALDGFYERQARGRGRFFTPGAIERLRPVFVSNLLQMTPGVYIAYRGTRPQVMMRSGFRPCVPTFYLDGQRVPLDPELTLDDWVTGSSIRALEIYRNRLDTPVEFHSHRDCGVIVAWTDFGLGTARHDGQAVQTAPRRMLYAALAAATLTAMALLIGGR